MRPGRAVLSGQALFARIAPLAVRRHVPLLAIRLADLERIAWKEGRSEARRVQRRARELFASGVAARIREADLIAHDRSSETFAIALAARGRLGEGSLLPEDCRAALERAAAAFAALPFHVQTGWTLVSGARHDLSAELAIALERGLRERQRLDFFSPIAHEMRTPLTAIRGYLETLLEERTDAATMRRFLETARGETLRLGRLIDGMFAVSLLDAEPAGNGNPSQRRARTLPQGALDHAVAALLPTIRRRGIRLDRAQMPVTPVAANLDHLVQVFVNVVGNAVEHGRDGGSIAIEGERRGDAIEISVDDDGPGIPEREREAVFDFGYRTAHAGPGTGLGLAVVRRLLEHAGGSAWASSSSLGGARITIRLPIATG